MRIQKGIAMVMQRPSVEVPGKRILPMSIQKNWELYLMITPVVVYFIFLQYLPMYGIQIAFKDFYAVKGITGSPWIGFENFERFFRSYQFPIVLKNTVGISLYEILVGFPFPILLALIVNEMRSGPFKNITQTVTYAPHFLSVVVLCGMVMEMLSPTVGVVNVLIKALGGKAVYFMTNPAAFKTIYVFSGIWQNAGYDSILYIAALAGIDVQLYEAATVDGASKWKKLLYVTLPGLIPTVTIMFILRMGSVMSVGFTKVYLLQNDLNLSASEVISTYVYKKGLLGSEFSFASAVDLFNAVINMTMLVIVNKLSKKVGETSLW